MLKKLITTTFLTAAIAFPALAAGTDAGAPATTGTMQQTPAAPGAVPSDAGTAKPAMPAMPAMGNKAAEAPTSTTAPTEAMQASNIIGAEVTDAQGNSIGKIGDILLSPKGEVSSYVINVGGFLGIGDKPVALSTQQVTIVADASGSLKASTAMTKDTLNAQPEFKAPQPEAAPSAASPATGAGSTMN